MTSMDFLNKVHKILDSQEYNLSYSPAKSKNYMLYCNGNFIGGLFDEELCFVYADSVSELLGQPEPVYRGYSSTAQHRMLVIPEEHRWCRRTGRPRPRSLQKRRGCRSRLHGRFLPVIFTMMRDWK